ncbi:EpsG family protein [Sphingomonas sp. GC_Shp_1]|uniref:EpsG family protein n=1 Tax=unclassified Sphingomonas TaxID=196159 RepID=UPI00226BA12E
MLVYWLIFAFWSVGAIQSERRRDRDPRRPLFIVTAVAMVVLIGFRFQVGTDWLNYLDIYNNVSLLTFFDALRATDPGYGFFNWLAAQLGYGVVFVNFLCAILFVYGFATLAWRQPNPALAALVATPYLIIVVSMGYTRQAAALGLLCLAITDASDRKLLRIVVLVGLAALLHKSAILMLPIILAPILLRNYVLGALGVIVSAALFFFILRSSADGLVGQYVTSTYDSQGAAIRITMNVVAAGLFLAFRNRMDFSYFQRIYWTCNSVVAILSIVALAVFSASSGVDRFSVYLIPLQIVTYSRLPYAFSKDNRAVASALFAVIFYSFCVQAVWLNFADNARSWLPYRNVLWSST